MKFKLTNYRRTTTIAPSDQELDHCGVRASHLHLSLFAHSRPNASKGAGLASSASGTAIDVSLSKTACASGSFQKTERTGPTDCRRWQRPSLNFRPARPSSMASCAFVTTEVAPISEHSTPKCAPAPARRVANGILRLRYNVRRRCRP